MLALWIARQPLGREPRRECSVPVPETVLWNQKTDCRAFCGYLAKTEERGDRTWGDSADFSTGASGVVVDEKLTTVPRM